MEVAGIDSRQRRHALLAKVDLEEIDPAAARRDALALLELGGKLGLHAPAAGAGEDEGSLLVGLSARFFHGPLDGRDNRRRRSWRPSWPAPRCLKTMSARGDEHFAAVSTLGAIAACESDLLLVAEADSEAPVLALAESLAGLARERPGIRLRPPLRGWTAPGGRDPLGHVHGVSNLQELRASDPGRYRDHVYIGDAEPRYRGDSYLAYRRYRVDLDRWRSESEPAREEIVGRSAAGDRLLGGRDRAHVRQANPRGVGRTQFGSRITPRDVRILRRAFTSEDDGDGLLFLAFQADIQQRGFEYVNNEWLMAEGFLGGRDPLLDPTRGFVEPLDGCYYWVPVATDPRAVFDALVAT